MTPPTHTAGAVRALADLLDLTGVNQVVATVNNCGTSNDALVALSLHTFTDSKDGVVAKFLTLTGALDDPSQPVPFPRFGDPRGLEITGRIPDLADQASYEAHVFAHGITMADLPMGVPA